MNAELKRIVKWAVVGAIAGFVTVILVSKGMPMGHRITCGLMAAGGGLVVFAMVAANFSKDNESHESAPH